MHHTNGLFSWVDAWGRNTCEFSLLLFQCLYDVHVDSVWVIKLLFLIFMFSFYYDVHLPYYITNPFVVIMRSWNVWYHPKCPVYPIIRIKVQEPRNQEGATNTGDTSHLYGVTVNKETQPKAKVPLYFLITVMIAGWVIPVIRGAHSFSTVTWIITGRLPLHLQFYGIYSINSPHPLTTVHLLTTHSFLILLVTALLHLSYS